MFAFFFSFIGYDYVALVSIQVRYHVQQKQVHMHVVTIEQKIEIISRTIRYGIGSTVIIYRIKLFHFGTGKYGNWYGMILTS